MSENENEIETGNDEDFAALFEASYKTKRIQNGQAVEGTIVAIGADAALVDVGAKGEATIDLGELKNHDGVLEAKVGDKIHATVVSTMGGLTLWSADESPGIPHSFISYVHSILPSGSRYKIKARPLLTVGRCPEPGAYTSQPAPQSSNFASGVTGMIMSISPVG